MKYFVILIFTALLPACLPSTNKSKSILILAVDELSFNDITCEPFNNKIEGEGFTTLCNDSVRFTHAFTTSTLAQPALTSILTGKYPVTHKVHTNGKNFLSARYITPAEIAINKGYKTAFFSAGPPILKKSGLHQGFETFNDHIALNLKASYNSSSSIVKKFEQWMGQKVGSSPFFATVYLSDLLFSNIATVTNKKEIRESTRSAQILELSESLYRLIQYLKSKDIYSSTTIILVGLKGHIPLPTIYSHPSVSLRSNNTQVTLLIKPSYKKRDLNPTWKVDTNVTLADIGITLFDFLDTNPPKSSLQYLQIHSLSPFFK